MPTTVTTEHENTLDGQQTRRVVTVEDATGETEQYRFHITEDGHEPVDGENPTQTAVDALEAWAEDQP